MAALMASDPFGQASNTEVPTGRSARDRRPLNYWVQFNDWWRHQLDETGKRPDAESISRWYALNADAVWGESKPTLKDTRTHAKCLRSVDSVRSYFRQYRAIRKQASQDIAGQDASDVGQSDQAGRLASSSGAAGRMSSHHPSQYGAENKFQVQSYKLLPPSVRPESGHIKALQPIISVPSDLALPDQNSTLRLMGPNPAAGFTQTPADFLSGLGSSYAAAGALQQPSSSLPPLAHHHQLQQPSAASLLSNLLSSGAGQQQHHMAGMQAAAEVAAAAAAAHHQQQLQGAAAAAADHDLRGLLADPAHLELLSALLQTPFFFPGASTEQALQQIMQPAGGAAGAAAAAAPGPSGAAATIAVPAGHMAAGAAAVQAVPGEGTPLAARPPSRSAFDAAPQGGMTPSAFFV